MVETLSNEVHPEFIEIEVFAKFSDLFSFIPTNFKNRRDKNYSPEVYLALSKTNCYNVKP